MNDTTENESGRPTDAAGGSPHDEQPPFEPRRMRSLIDARRPNDDRMIAGVSSGIARQIGLDPIVVRILFVVLMFVGLAGIILYTACWLLLPSEGQSKSVAAEWFHLDKNEEHVRVAGLIGAGILAFASIVGDTGWATWGIGWIIVPFAVLYFLFGVLPQRRRQEKQAHAVSSVTSESGGATQVFTQSDLNQNGNDQREPKSPALFLYTLCAIAVSLGILGVLDDAGRDIGAGVYLAVSLGIVALGLLIGTFWGNAGALIPVGLLLALVLAATTLLPSGSFGDTSHTPTSVADVQTTYKHGIGRFQIDLTEVDDLDSLRGRTIDVEAGIGQTIVRLPDNFPVTVDAKVRAGQIDIFNRRVDGTGNHLIDRSKEPNPLTIKIRQSLGQIEVIRS